MPSEGPTSMRVVVAAADPATRAQLHDLVERDWAWRVVGEAADALEAFRRCRLLAADLLLTDAALDGLDVRSLIEAFRRGGDTAVVTLLDLPHQHATVGGAGFLKGVPASRAREVVDAALAERARARFGGRA